MKNTNFVRSLLAVFCFLTMSLFANAQTTYNADPASLGNIPDGPGPGAQTPGAPRNVTFAVSGATAAITNVSVSITGTHTWMGDMAVTLIAPGNAAQFELFAYTGATTATGVGDSSDFAGPYVFADSQTGGWWAAATAAGATVPVATGGYRTAARTTGAATTMNAAFAGLTPAQINGTWTLRFTDGAVDDVGSVTAASLTLTAGAAAAPDAPVDFNGDGKTDFVVVRADGGPALADPEMGSRNIGERMANLAPSANKVIWYRLQNGAATVSNQQWGLDTDFFVMEDFDGDGKDDNAVWRPAAAGSSFFYILRSSNNTAQIENFGQTGDDPSVVGDYDGDGKADVAVYRVPPSGTAGQAFFYYRGSLNNPSGNITYVPFGARRTATGDADFPAPGDYDGDGRHDAAVVAGINGTQGTFIVRQSSNGTVRFVDWGLSSDFIIPGDYDGDGRTDFCVRRAAGSVRTYYIKSSGAAGTEQIITFGRAGNNTVQGDYDGDGKTDLAEWSAGVFNWRSSANGSTNNFMQWGATNDFPIAAYNVH